MTTPEIPRIFPETDIQHANLPEQAGSIAQAYAHLLNEPLMEKPLEDFLNRIALVNGLVGFIVQGWDFGPPFTKSLSFIEIGTDYKNPNPDLSKVSEEHAAFQGVLSDLGVHVSSNVSVAYTNNSTIDDVSEIALEEQYGWAKEDPSVYLPKLVTIAAIAPRAVNRTPDVS